MERVTVTAVAVWWRCGGDGVGGVGVAGAMLSASVYSSR